MWIMNKEWSVFYQEVMLMIKRIFLFFLVTFANNVDIFLNKTGVGSGSAKCNIVSTTSANTAV